MKKILTISILILFMIMMGSCEKTLDGIESVISEFDPIREFDSVISSDFEDIDLEPKENTFETNEKIEEQTEISDNNTPDEIEHTSEIIIEVADKPETESDIIFESESVSDVQSEKIDITSETEGTKEQDEKINTEKESDTISHNHLFIKTILKEPTCGIKGMAKFNCKCGESYIEDIPETGKHNYVIRIEKEATCITTGIKTYTCGTCGNSYEESIPKTEHKFVEYDRTIGTIGDSNEIRLNTVITFSQCSVCGEYTYDYDKETVWNNELINIFESLQKSQNKYKVFEYYCKYISNSSFPTEKELAGISPPRGEISKMLFTDESYSYPINLDKIREDLNGFAKYLGYTAYSTNMDSLGEVIDENNGSWSFPVYISNKSSSYENYRTLVEKIYIDLTTGGVDKADLPTFYIYFKPADTGEYWMFFIIC